MAIIDAGRVSFRVQSEIEQSVSKCRRLKGKWWSKLEFQFCTEWGRGQFWFERSEYFNKSATSAVLCRIIVPNFTAMGQCRFVDDLAHFRRPILGMGHFLRTVLKGAWTELH